MSWMEQVPPPTVLNENTLGNGRASQNQIAVQAREYQGK